MASGDYSSYYGQNAHNSYYQGRPPVTTQPPEYGATYNRASSYGGGQDWYGLNSGDASIGRAAETLSNLGNATRQTAVSGPQYPGFAALNSPQPISTAAYGTSYSNTNPSLHQTGQAAQQVRPDSVNSGHSSSQGPYAPPRKNAQSHSSSQYNSQHRQHDSIGTTQRVASPAPRQHTPGYGGNAQAPPNTARHRTTLSQTQHTAAHATSPPISSTPQTTSSTTQRAVSGQSQTYTVDPSEVYDPWPEYQRRKAAEDAQRLKRQAEEAERKRAAEEAEALRLQEEQRHLQNLREVGQAARPSENYAPAAQSEQRPTAMTNGVSDEPGASTKKAKKAKALKVSVQAPAEQAGAASSSAPKKQRKKKKQQPITEDSDEQMLAMLKAMKAKDPERFKRLMAAGADDGETVPVQSSPPHQPEVLQPVQTSIAQTAPLQLPPIEPTAAQAPPARPTPARAPPVRPTPVQAPPVQPTPTQAPHVQAPVANMTVSQAAEKPTIWPPEKKKLLANVAADYLNNYPGNGEKHIQAHSVIEILDQNPSYVLLCERLEAHGLKIDRASFARTLLQAVPDVNSAAKKQRNERDVELQKRNNELVDLTARSTPVAVPIPNMATEGVPGPPHQRSETPSTAAASKEQAARKRTFDELVDLTAFSDDEPEPKETFLGPPPVYQSNKNVHYPGPSFVSNSGVPYQSTPDPWSYHQPAGALQRTQPPRPDSQMQSLPERLRDVVIVTNISRNKARRRTSYDSRTIARDVLLATGRHPDMHHLNAHLQSLRQRFGLVNDKADLETLRWDLIDPGDPLPLPNLEDDNESVVVGSEGSAGESDSDSPMPERPPTSKNDLRRNIGDSDPSKPRESPQAPTYLHSRELERARQETSRGRGGRPRGRPPRSTFPSVTTRGTAVGQKQSEGSEQPEPQGNLHERFAFRGFNAINAPVGTGKPRAENGSGTSKGPATPSSPSTSTDADKHPKLAMSGTGSGYASFQPQYNPDGTRKRGRPVGWRKSVHMDKSKLTMADRTKASDKAKSHDVPEPEPRYPVFRCLYNDCTSQLHNLKTLRAHVNKVHGQQHSDQRRYQCLWDGCSQSQGNTTGQQGASKQRVAFQTQPDWWLHLEKEHFDPIAWKMGDGPTSGLSDARDSEQSESYLSDAHGRQVTPRIRTPPAAVPISERGHRQDDSYTDGRSRGRPPVDRATLERKALDAEEAVRMKKRKVGIGLDRGGATLANDTRRQGFIDDEDFERVVED